jgi:hypothetical protein
MDLQCEATHERDIQYVEVEKVIVGTWKLRASKSRTWRWERQGKGVHEGAKARVGAVNANNNSSQVSYQWAHGVYL